MIVLEIHVDLPSRLTEEPCILVLLYVGLVIDDTDRWLVVVVDRDGGVLEVRIALIARLYAISTRSRYTLCGPFARSLASYWQEMPKLTGTIRVCAPGQRGREYKPGHSQLAGRQRP